MEPSKRRGPRTKEPAARRKTSQARIKELRRRLQEAEDSLNAIRTGAVDALVVRGPLGDKIYTMKDADRPYRVILESMRDGAVTLREDGLILYANKTLAALLDVPLERLLGSNLFDKASAAGRESLKRIVERAARGDGQGDVEFHGGTGRPLIMHLSLAPMTIDNLQVLSGVVADITEERRTQQRIRQMERTEALGRLAGGVAHDLNNILQPILVNAELLLDEIEPESPGYALLTNVIQAAGRQKDLVSRILSFTRQSQKVLQLLDVTPLVVEALKLLKPSLPAGIDINLFADAGADAVQGDPTEIHELITNLCTNAADAMEAGGGTIRVSLRSVFLTEDGDAQGMPPGRYLELGVKDTGCGIPPHDLDRIFDPFFTTKEAGRGSGIGLSVVRGIVESHGGAIAVDSKVGEGTEVTVILPTSDDPAPAAARRSQALDASPAGRSVLVVDDEDMVLDTLTRALTSFGHQPTAVKDGASALALFQSLPRHFDLAVIDQNMPKMNGLALASEIRKINADVPILLATGYSKTVDDESARAAGVTAVIMKPLSLRDLRAAVVRALAGSSERI